MPTAPLRSTPRSFGFKHGTVRLIQTHIGWVYLIGKFAFKLKKHVKFDFLNFKTLAGRHWACAREINLNRRLCPDLYIGLCPVLKDKRGNVRVASDLVLTDPDAPFKTPCGEKLIDWAIWMHRMPEHRMLDRLLDKDTVTRSAINAIADELCEFYARQRKATDIRALAKSSLKSIKFNINENLEEGHSIDPKLLSPGALRLIDSLARGYLKRNIGLLETRAKTGFVLDCHGDLRAENVCLPERKAPLLFDCIEFNDRFRICDTALDAAFLAMDLDSHQRHDLSTVLIARYMQKFDRHLSPKLLNFYLGYRAFVKAKVGAWIAADKNVKPAQRAASQAQSRMLFNLGVRYALQRQRVLLVFCGVSGSGKSSLADHLSARLNCVHLATDIIRDEVVPRGTPAERRYAPAVSGRVYQILFERAAALLSEKRPVAPPQPKAVPTQVVICDGTFLSASNRRQAVKVARDNNAVSILVHAASTPKAIAAHIQQRSRSGVMFGSEARLEIARRQQAGFEAPARREGFDDIVTVDTSGNLHSATFAAWDGVMAALAKHLD